jgi:hypothetical protein
MDRQIVYSGQIPLSTDLLSAEKNAYLALLKLAAGVLGTNTLINGLSCVPTNPASDSVIVNPGEVYSLQTLDANAYSDLGTDSRSVLKQGIITSQTTLNLAQPATIGYSVNYLIEVAFSETDAGSTILPYYNSGNPAQPYSGPGGTGAFQNTVRQDTIIIQAKAGIAAPTNSQATPTVDVGFIGLFVVQVDYGQTAIGSNHITHVSGAPFISETLTQKISEATADLRYAQPINVQNGSYVYGADTGSANAYAVTYTPAISAPSDGMVLIFTPAHSSTGPSTLNGAPIYGLAGASLQGGEIFAGGRAQVKWNSSLGVWILLNCEGGPLQVADATASKHALNRESADARYLQSVNLFSNVYNVRSGRQFGTVYTNNTGKPMFVSVNALSNPSQGGTLNLYVNGLTIASSAGGFDVNITVCGIVPVGGTYEAGTDYATLTNWTETY